MSGDQPIRYDSKKIEMIDGVVVGFVGARRYRQPAIKWWQDGCQICDMPKTADGADNEWVLIIFQPDEVQVYVESNPYPNSFPYPYSCGSGEDFAYGALLAGATPYDAIAIAARCNVKTGGKIATLTIPNALREAAE